MNVKLVRYHYYESEDGLTFHLKFSHQAPSKNFSGSFKFDSRSAQMLPHEDRYDLVASDGRRVRDINQDGVSEAFLELGYKLVR